MKDLKVVKKQKNENIFVATIKIIKIIKVLNDAAKFKFE